jgi:ABC-type multidrug transport system fused ATPase/permease subunit
VSADTVALRLPARLTPARFLLALARARCGLLAASGVLGALWLAPGALLPLVVGRAVDEGVAGGERDALFVAAALVVGIGVLQAVFGTLLNYVGHTLWIHAAQTSQRTIAEHTTRLGAALREQSETGDVMAFTSSDVNRLGNTFEVFGRLIGAVVAFVVVGVVLLGRSPLLGTVALIGVPLAVLGIGPLIAPLQRRKEAQREQLSAVNALAADIVSGLRILRGVGGERQFLRRFRRASGSVRQAGVDVARSESWLSGAEVLLPGLVTVAITWLGARLAVAGTISVGELVAFYGAAAFLVIPVTTATEAAGATASALVAARKACRLLGLRARFTEPADPVALPQPPLELHDSAAAFTAVAGKLTVVAGPGGEALAARLARFTEPAPGEQVRVGGVRADRVALAELRRRVVYAHNQDVWFSGVLRDELAPPEGSTVSIEQALHAADAGDIVAGLPGGLDELIGERGREVSGGQRQRLTLARALVTGADVLLLDEPTSAVDAHTEARIAERVAELRRGRTTVVFSRSPLWTVVADEVVGQTVTDEKVGEATPCS